MVTSRYELVLCQPPPSEEGGEDLRTAPRAVPSARNDAHDSSPTLQHDDSSRACSCRDGDDFPPDPCRLCSHRCRMSSSEHQAEPCRAPCSRMPMTTLTSGGMLMSTRELRVPPTEFL